MSIVYELIGRFVVEFARRRDGQEIRVAAAVSAVGAGLIAAGVWAATRDSEQE